MTFDERVRVLCERAAGCESETEAVKLARQVHGLLHERIEGLRVDLLSMPLLLSSSNDVNCV
jgi:hypothetical protein